MSRDELRQSFKSITGNQKDVEVEQYLEACGWDLATAVDLFFARASDEPATPKRKRKETTKSSSNGAGPSSQPDVCMVSDDEDEIIPIEASAKPAKTNGVKKYPVQDEVRAPMNFRSGPIVHQSFEQQYGGNRNNRPTSIFEAPRHADFRLLAETQRKNLLNGQGATNGYHPSGDDDQPSSSRMATRNARSLSALFQPPVDLTFEGDWESAKEEAKARGSWILVNVQDLKEFASQTLNRDVWSNAGVKELVRSNFLFWQIYNDSVDGRRMSGYYSLQRFPAVFIIDPRTGELVHKVSLKTQDAVSLCDSLTQFIDEFPDFATRDRYLVGDAAPDDTSQPMPDEAHGQGSSVDDESGGRKRRQRGGEGMGGEEDEESRRKKQRMDKEAEALEESTRGLSVVDREEWKRHVSPAGVPLKVMLRFPDGMREAVDVTSETKLMALMLCIRGRGYTPEDHHFVLSYPKREYSSDRAEDTLGTLGFSKSEMVHVELK